ncbi:hypothetical protein PInf_017368 [Phytophthora infestans]|nr:hypothetical protein PInf_017368 [Phytophthora infestans]
MAATSTAATAQVAEMAMTGMTGSALTEKMAATCMAGSALTEKIPAGNPDRLPRILDVFETNPSDLHFPLVYDGVLAVIDNRSHPKHYPLFRHMLLELLQTIRASTEVEGYLTDLRESIQTMHCAIEDKNELLEHVSSQGIVLAVEQLKGHSWKGLKPTEDSLEPMGDLA